MADRFSTKLTSIQNNPYAVLERTWRDVKGESRKTTENKTPSEPSQTRAEALNLSAVCMSNIMMLEDKHLPSVLIRMYEFCLERSVNCGYEEENEARLRLLNFIIHRWHETREKLMFIRDAARILAALTRSVLGDHLSIAIESTPVNQQHVMRELMRTLRRESCGMSLGTFLERYNTTSSSEFLFNDMTFELFDREDVFDYDRARQGGMFDSYLGEMLRAPVLYYLRRVLISITRAFCNLKLHVPSSVSERLFAESVPSWVEEDTETGLLRMDSASRERLQRARENISELLMRGREKISQTVTSDSQSLEVKTPLTKKRKAIQFEEEFNDSRTVDTASFIGDINPHYSNQSFDTVDTYNQTTKKTKIQDTINEATNVALPISEIEPVQAAIPDHIATISAIDVQVDVDDNLIRISDTERDLLAQITNRIERDSLPDLHLTERSVTEDDASSIVSSMPNRNTDSVVGSATIRAFVRADQDLSALAQHNLQEERIIEQVLQNSGDSNQSIHDTDSSEEVEQQEFVKPISDYDVSEDFVANKILHLPDNDPFYLNYL